MWLAVAFAVTAAGQLFSHLLLARLLGADDFGEVATLYNLMSFVGVPLVAVQLTVTALVSRGGSITGTLRRYGAWGLIAGTAAAVTAPLWAGALALSSVSAARAAAWFVPAAFIVAVTRGNAIGQARTSALAAAMCIAAAVRVAASVVGAGLFGVVGATAAVVASEASLGLVLLIIVRPRGKDLGAVPGWTAASATSTQVAMWIVINVDLLWARRLLDPVDAGRYLLVAAVTLGLVSFGQAFLWHRASTAITHAAGLRIVVRSAAIVAVTTLVAVPAAIVSLPRVLGPTFVDLTPLLCIGGLWAVLASLVHTSTATQIIAADRRLWRIVPAGCVAVVVPPVATATFGARPEVLAVAAVLNTAGAAVVVVVPQILRSRRSPYSSVTARAEFATGGL